MGSTPQFIYLFIYLEEIIKLVKTARRRQKAEVLLCRGHSLASGCPAAWGSLLAPAEEEEEEEHITGRYRAWPIPSGSPSTPCPAGGSHWLSVCRMGAFCGVETHLTRQIFPTDSFRELYRSMCCVHVALQKPGCVPCMCLSRNFLLPSDDCALFYR